MRLNEFVTETAAWQKKSGKNKNGGLNKKGVDSYRKEHPGSKLKTAVTKKPSEIKKGSKDAKRRKSFCARMKGMKKHRTGSKTAHDPNSRINKSLRKWHCESVEELKQLLESAQNIINEGLVKPFEVAIAMVDPNGKHVAKGVTMNLNYQHVALALGYVLQGGDYSAMMAADALVSGRAEFQKKVKQLKKIMEPKGYEF